MNRFVTAVLLSSMLPVCGAMAQSPLDGLSAETHTSSDVSSSSAMLAAMQSPVTGEPYVADKVTRSVWTLADGTTITHEADTKIARDGEGRVREEIENTSAGSVGGKQINLTSESITIADPIDHSITILSAAPLKMAMRMQMPNLAALGTRLHGGGANGEVSGAETVAPPPPPQGLAGHSMNLGTANPEVAAQIAKMHGDKDEVQTEELGADAIGGLRVTGKRTTTTIATGKIGNDRPIVITHEEWYSPDLKIVVKSDDNDPRTGERTMVLEGLTIGDPDPALFKVPEGYNVQDMSEMMKSLGGLAPPPKP